MTRRSLAGRPRVGLLALLLSGALVAAGPPPASADPGRAPAPREYRVLQKLHTDAIATFLDGEHFVLGSKADVFEGLGTRLDPEQLWFHVDDASRLTVPAGMEFIAPAGTQVWVAPQSNPSGGQLWPGFSTESVPVGAIENDTTTLRLVELQGPGTLELFTTGTFGARERLWSSDDTQFSSFQVPRTHMHANWAFTQPGTYRLTVEAAARRAGQPVSTIATYTFVVGALPADIATTTTLAASAGEVTAGDPVALTATVTPASAEGYVEFRDGSTVLGHQAVTGGTAMLTVPDLAPGDHALTAVFVPKVANLADGSTSAVVDVTVREPGNVPFSVTGIQGSYGVGDTLSAKVAGASLKEGQQFRWLVRPIGSPSTGSNRQTGTSETFSATVDALWDETELSVTVREGATVVAQSPWVPLRVEQVGTRPTVTLAANTPSPLLPGDVAEFVVSGRQPAEGETLQWGFLSGVTWIDVPRQLGGNWTYTFPDALTSRLTNITTGVTTVQDYPYAYGVRILKDGVTVARSLLTTLKIGPRELQVQGHRQLYREGGTVQMDAAVYPVRDSDRFSYTWTFTNGDVTEVWGQDRPAPALTKTGLTKAAHDGGTLTLTLNNHGEPAQRRQFKLNVTDDASSQILAFSTLAGHYHQGDAVALELTVDPPPVQGDTLTWEWRWPGTEQWVPMAGVVDNTYRVTAEQALDGVEIRAKLTFANPLTPPAISETRTIHVDDHGTAPNQKVTIAGETAYQAGDTATLTARVAPATVLDRYQWYAKAPGAAEPTAIAGANGATHSFSASSSDDGSEYTVAVLRPGGQVAYGPSAPVRLSVAPREAAVEESVGGVVPATLALTLGAPAGFGTFLPGVAREYRATTTATVVSSAGMATLTVGDPGDTHRGHLVNGAVALPQPLQGLGTIKTYDGPVANDVATVEFKQRIGSADPLRTGTYSKTLTFTLATNTP